MTKCQLKEQNREKKSSFLFSNFDNTVFQLISKLMVEFCVLERKSACVCVLSLSKKVSEVFSLKKKKKNEHVKQKEEYVFVVFESKKSQ